jgi:ABC-2 type transport system permease protein
VATVVLIISLIVLGIQGINWALLILALLLAAMAFSAMGAFVSVAVKEVFEAQTLANFIRFPMMFLGGVFIPVAEMPPTLQVVAHLLPLTYAVDALRIALTGGLLSSGAVDLSALAAFTILFFSLATRYLARTLAWWCYGCSCSIPLG